ncbi:hypothetical protein [Streptomyces sp. NPDC093225]|uniref:hypothetical protein n=1 Tax=Streptomyces sp. NPDC093225 TaxID=3366034 RepID=UPI0037F72D41
MKTCPRFSRIRASYERDMGYLANHSARHQGTAPGKASARIAAGTKQRMAKALTRHYEHCLECA